jgi:hypothetical protein
MSFAGYGRRPRPLVGVSSLDLAPWQASACWGAFFRLGTHVLSVIGGAFSPF